MLAQSPIEQAFIQLSASQLPSASCPVAVAAPAAVLDLPAVASPPVPCIRTVTLPANAIIVQLDGARPYRRLLRVLAPQVALGLEFSYVETFAAPEYGIIADNNSDIPIFAGQALYARQTSALALDISILIEPRGEGR